MRALSGGLVGFGDLVFVDMGAYGNELIKSNFNEETVLIVVIVPET